MFKKNDIILFVIAILLGLAVIFFINITKTEGSKVIVTVDGAVVKSFPLNEDTLYTVDTEDGYNTFEIKDGYVKMIEANCPDKICVNHNKIHYDNETIVCLPNKVVLEIVGGEEDEVDIIAN
ncbi:MAG: NusG domain II-containing protein [Mobilitalea sp.]